MTETFSSPPLVEIIAEIRWADPTAVAAPGTPYGLHMPHSSTAQEDFLMRFGAQAFQQNFVRTERMVPPGFPVPVGQVTHRFRPDEQHENLLFRSTMLQVGPGVFAANGVPPYKSWNEFRPFVQAGVNALILALPEQIRAGGLAHVSLRYVDAFTSRFTEGISSQEFLRLLGINFSIPDVFQEVREKDAPVEQAVQFSFALGNGAKLTLQIAPGDGPQGSAMVMTTVIAFEGGTVAKIDEIMGRFDSARDVIHSAFLRMTKPFEKKMSEVI